MFCDSSRHLNTISLLAVRKRTENIVRVFLLFCLRESLYNITQISSYFWKPVISYFQSKTVGAAVGRKKYHPPSENQKCSMLLPKKQNSNGNIIPLSCLCSRLYKYQFNLCMFSISHGLWVSDWISDWFFLCRTADSFVSTSIGMLGQVFNCPQSLSGIILKLFFPQLLTGVHKIPERWFSGCQPRLEGKTRRRSVRALN